MTTQVKQVQNVVAISAESKAIVKGFTEIFSAPSKSKPEGMNASEREIFDAMVKFVSDFRFTTEERFVQVLNEESGEMEDTDELEEYEHDHFADVVNEVLKERMNITRVVSSSKVKALESEREALQKQFDELQAKYAAKLAETTSNEY
jgi:hypothetical protein